MDGGGLALCGGCYRSLLPARCRLVDEGCDDSAAPLLQSETQALDDRISEPYGVREPGGISLSGCHPNRVQANRARGVPIRALPDLCFGIVSERLEAHSL